jgi:DNA-binding SARP family transcriptional activator/TolB-like protein/Tfp pilus assembly protein PilF
VRSSRVDTFTLVTLGRLTLLSPRGDESESLAKRRLKLALLAVLATAKRPVSRATLAEMFWGEQEECRARHSLSDALSHLRRELGRLAVASQGSEVWLNPDAPLALDLATFEDAIAARELSRAASLYTGPFLDGVEIEAGPSFEQWASRERRRLETLFLQVCGQQCLAYARAREWEECGSLAARWLETAPLSVDAALYRLNAVKSPGTREAAQRALDEFEQLSGRLAREFDLAPEKPVLELAQNLRDSLETLPAAPIAVAASASPAQVAPLPAPNEAPAPTRPRAPLTEPARTGSKFRRHLARATTVGVGLVALVAALAARSRTADVNVSTRPRVAIAVDVKDADSTTAWLADGLPQMMMSELSRSPEVEVVPPAQVRALLRRRGARATRPTAGEDLRDLAHRLGATLVVSGTVGRDDRAIVLDLAVRDVATGHLLRNDALSRRDAPALADEAAARVLATVNAQRPGFRFTDLETSSVEAFQHFVRAMQAAQEGRTHEAYREMDAAIALDSGFVTAVHARMDWALATGESDVADRLRGVLARHGDRSSEFDQLQTQVLDALYRGETERSEAMARQLVRRFPRDPRAYGVLNGVLGNTGQFEAAESMWQAALSLDSLAMEAGPGPCGPCVGYGNLARIQSQEGKWQAAEHSARRWVELQPDAPASWEMLAGVLSYRQRHREAIDAVERAVTLSGHDPSTLDMWARLLIAARQYDTGDSLVHAWLTSESPQLRASAYDLRVLLARERGELRASNVALDRSEADLPNAGVQTLLVRGNNLGRLGDYAAAELLYERSAHGSRLDARFPPVGAASRGFCWHHALLADAIAPSGDTVRLKGLADTLAVGCARSFFGRDRRLHHHVRGLLAMMQGRWFDAEAELQQARWGVAESWTRSNVALAKTEMALNQPRAALATLRDAYASPLDGMGRYQPRSELDLLMAQAFTKAGDADSARMYEAYVRRAWRNADPELKRLLAQLPAAN